MAAASNILDHCLNLYFAATSWRTELQYAALLRDARAILDFNAPAGLSVAVGKSVSPVLRSHYSIGLPSSGSIGFLATSVPLHFSAPPPPEGGSHSALQGNTKAQSSAILDAAASELKIVQGTKPDAVVGSYLMYGRLFRDRRLEYVLARRLTQNTLVSMSGVSSWRPEQSFVHYNIATSRDSWGHEFCFSSEAAMFGFRAMRTVTGNFAIGGELYYLANEVSGGMSLGARHASKYATTTVSANPILGHVSTSYTTWVLPGLRGACRYDYNVHSFESNLSVGVAYSPNADCRTSLSALETASTPGQPGTLIKVRYGIARGLALIYQQCWGALGVQLGVEASGKSGTLGLDVSYTLN
ncbi:hypothetical protein BC828DRAFT_375853 [Blastocladiella britannica]|nr:hypothetical protein BC828DRAFT_375853 [Blastocladiella britannica]